MSSGVTTRALERGVGEGDDLWDVIVNNDDVCFKHILPRLNRNDVKFLFEVNTETRALIKRSSREDDLRKCFKVEEMSSVSTLEIAWENRSSSRWDDTCFCTRVAWMNKLEFLKWIREEKKCEWDEYTIAEAARQGNLEMVKYCVANGCPVNERACTFAARNGHLECLKYLREEVKTPWNQYTLELASLLEQLECLRYAIEKKCPEWQQYENKLKRLEEEMQGEL